MSLRAILTTMMAVLVTLSLVAAASLVLLTDILETTAANLGDSVEGVRLAEELEVDLLTHYRRSSTQGTPASDAEDERLLAEIEANFRPQLSELNRTATSDAERKLLRDIDERISHYLREHDGQTRDAPQTGLSTSLDSALRSLEQLIQFNVDEATAARARAAHWSRLADVLAVSLSVLLVMGVGGIIFWLRRYAFRPMLAISQSMRRFGAGAKRARAPEEGPSELRDMANTFNEMADSLASQQEQQLAFLAGVAHELRNPLSALKLSTALADSTRAPPTPERIQRTFGLVRRQVERLDRMVGDLLDATRIEAGNLDLQPELRDARDLAREVVELYRSGDNDHTLQLVLADAPALVRADASRLEQVLHNLVSNALKYSPSGSHVDVVVGTEEREVLLSVVDQGIGISEEEQRLLFAPFHRASNARRRAPGVGLGLSVARRIVEAHGGAIEVESRPGQGSTFRVRLPRATNEAHAPLLAEGPGSTPGDGMH